MDIITQRFIAISNKILAELRRIGDALGVLHTDAQQHIEAIRKADDAAEERYQSPPVPGAVPEIPEPAKHQQERSKTEKKWLERGNTLIAALTLAAVVVYAVYAKIQAKQATTAANAAKSAADTAAASLVIANRPWVGIKHRILKPLTFSDKVGESATITIEDTIENVGPTVALNVISWEELVPIWYYDHFRDDLAFSRRSEWCDAHRHLDLSGTDPSVITGYALFPKSPLIQQSTVVVPMKKVLQSASTNVVTKGKVSFAIVGCVCYRAPFEPTNGKMHETRFFYLIGAQNQAGYINPAITPSGTASEFGLVGIPKGSEAD